MWGRWRDFTGDRRSAFARGEHCFQRKRLGSVLLAWFHVAEVRQECQGFAFSLPASEEVAFEYRRLTPSHMECGHDQYLVCR